jgi:transaldolase
MKPTQQLHRAGQSIWLDELSRSLLVGGRLAHYMDDLCVSGLTSNPETVEHALRGTSDYEASIRYHVARGHIGEALVFDLVAEDVKTAADMLHARHVASMGVDGWVSLAVSPLLSGDTWRSYEAVIDLHCRIDRPNVLIGIPGTRHGLAAVEEAIFQGIPVNVTLLLSRDQYLGAASAYMRAIERRIASGLDPVVGSTASFHVGNWDSGPASSYPPPMRNRLGIAVAQDVYQAYRDMIASERFQRLMLMGGRPQRLIWTNTGAPPSAVAEDWYVKALAAPKTANAMPERTLLAFDDHGTLGALLSRDGGQAQHTLHLFAQAGVDFQAVAGHLQRLALNAYAQRWNDLLRWVAAQREVATIAR